MKKRNKIKIIVIIALLIISTGCTKSLTDKKNKPVKNEVTGQSLTENIICQPTSKSTLKQYKKHNVKIEKLPKCEKFNPVKEKYESIWTSFFVKPLAFVLLIVGKNIGSYALSLILISLLIRLIAYPFTKKTAMQSELMKTAQPELQRIQKKYENKKDQDSMTKQSQEMMAVYKKYNLSPMSGCLFSLIQLPILMAFFEAIQRTPALFEDKFLGLQLGTSPMVGIGTATFYVYIILGIIIGVTTYFSFKMNMAGSPSTDVNMKMMPVMMTGMITIMGLFMPSALGIYWATTNVFTIIQNILVKRSKKINGKA